MKNYLKVLYNKKKKPITSYPEKFVKYNIKRFNLKNKKLLEIGCGRGDFINEFAQQNVISFATDINDVRDNLNQKVSFSLNNISDEKLPFSDNEFDAIYSKSLIEHLTNHEIFFTECKRVLKKGGVLITYTPDWETQYLNFYDDITHIKPFTKISLLTAHKIYNFEECYVEKFFQLPLVWKFSILKKFCKFISLFIAVRSKNKFLRFSKELMLLSVAYKR
jgi:ubiquinone/menaquinone biosynthesis C-methylase UbiE